MRNIYPYVAVFAIAAICFSCREPEQHALDFSFGGTSALLDELEMRSTNIALVRIEDMKDGAPVMRVSVIELYKGRVRGEIEVSHPKIPRDCELYGDFKVEEIAPQGVFVFFMNRFGESGRLHLRAVMGHDFFRQLIAAPESRKVSVPSETP